MRRINIGWPDYFERFNNIRNRLGIGVRNKLAKTIKPFAFLIGDMLILVKVWFKRGKNEYEM